jgi:hypothetical protein
MNYLHFIILTTIFKQKKTAHGNSNTSIIEIIKLFYLQEENLWGNVGKLTWQNKKKKAGFINRPWAFKLQLVLHIERCKGVLKN